MSLLPIKKPEIGRRIKAVIKSDVPGTDKWDVCTAFLMAVNETDCDYRFADDNSELSYSSDVIYWEYIDRADHKPKKEE